MRITYSSKSKSGCANNRSEGCDLWDPEAAEKWLTSGLLCEGVNHLGGNGEVTEVPTEGTGSNARGGRVGDGTKIMCKRQRTTGSRTADLVRAWRRELWNAPLERINRVRRCDRVGGSM